MSVASQPPQPSTVKVAQVGRSAKWSLEKAQKAAAKFAYIHVGGKASAVRHLSGAKRTWEKPGEENTVYIRNFVFNDASNVQQVYPIRLTGTPDAIYAAIMAGDVPSFRDASAIQLMLTQAITPVNFNSAEVQADIKGELDAYAAMGKKSAKKSTARVYNLGQILWFAQHLKEATPYVTGTSKKEGGTGRVKSGRARSLKERLDKLAASNFQESVLDVSKLVSENKVVKIPLPTSGRGKPRFTTYFVGSYEPRITSDNYQSYEAALAALDANYLATYADQLAKARAYFNMAQPNVVPRERSPVVAPAVAAPAVAPTAVLSPTSRSPPRTGLGQAPTFIPQQTQGVYNVQQGGGVLGPLRNV